MEKIIAVKQSGYAVSLIVSKKDVINMAMILESSEDVSCFYVAGVNEKSQPKYFGATDTFSKWVSTIQQ